MLPPALRTERLLLDAVLSSDADAVFEYCQDATLQQYVPVPSPYGRADAVGYASGYAGNAAASTTRVLWALRLEGRFAGVIELVLEPLASATVGFWLGAPFRGAGIMTEAVRAICEYGFALDGLALDRIHWEAVVGNLGSAIVARRAGFTFEGTMRASLVHRDTRLDSWQASLLRSDTRDTVDGWPL